MVLKKNGSTFSQQDSTEPPPATEKASEEASEEASEASEEEERGSEFGDRSLASLLLGDSTIHTLHNQYLKVGVCVCVCFKNSIEKYKNPGKVVLQSGRNG